MEPNFLINMLVDSCLSLLPEAFQDVKLVIGFILSALFIIAGFDLLLIVFKTMEKYNRPVGAQVNVENGTNILGMKNEGHAQYGGKYINS